MAIVKKKKGHKGKEERSSKKSSEREEDDFELPTTRSEPESSLGGYTWLIFGEKKIGKTSLTAQMGEALHLFTEPGGKALRVYPVVIDSWRKFKKAVRKLRKDKRFDTVVVDIADKLWGMSEDYICEKLVIPDLSAEDWGKGWREHRKEFQREIDTLLAMGKGVVFISHAQEQEIETRDGDSYDRMMPTMPKRMREYIEGVVDIWAYYTYDKHRRVLQILGDDHVSAGHRLDGRFQTPDGRPLRRIDMGRSAKQSWRNIRDAFNNRFVPPKASDIDVSEEEETKTKKFKIKKRS